MRQVNFIKDQQYPIFYLPCRIVVFRPFWTPQKQAIKYSCNRYGIISFFCRHTLFCFTLQLATSRFLKLELLNSSWKHNLTWISTLILILYTEMTIALNIIMKHTKHTNELSINASLELQNCCEHKLSL